MSMLRVGNGSRQCVDLLHRCCDLLVGAARNSIELRLLIGEAGNHCACTFDQHLARGRQARIVVSVADSVEEILHAMGEQTAAELTVDLVDQFGHLCARASFEFALRT